MQLLREHPYGLFIFSNQTQDHWHFINVKYDAETEKRRLFRRISISPEERLRTASERLAMLDLQSIQPDMFGLQPLTIQSKHDEAFDVEAVTKQFFEEYKAIFRILEDDLKKQVNDHTWAHDYSLQFLNRCMFIYFIQRKGWLGNDRDFLLSFWKSYQRSGQSQNSFVDNWLRVLFFEAFNGKFHGGHNYLPAEIVESLSLAPYLNGGLFTESKLDQEHKATVSDRRLEQILRFLERYNFTISEDSPLDKEVAVDPEMIGKVYESLVNVSEEVDERGEAGIFYTPRTEIDLMCRLSLVDHLANHLGDERKELLNQLVFALEPDEKTDADRAIAGATLWPALSERLHDITVLDPACGSGSFLVGMLNIMDDLQGRANRQLGITEASYERKKRIIGQSLYGVDVMEWACHVAELRLWLALIIDADFTREELHVRREPLLPHFSFKVRCGDSLVQEVGGINLGHIAASQEIPPPLKARITTLKDEKLKFYNNDTTCQFHSVDALKNEEKRLFSDILDDRGHVIQERIKALRRKLEGPQERRIRLDGTIETAPPHQMNMDAARDRKTIEDLTSELAQTEASRKALSAAREVPFVWDIAFVEIFESEMDGFDIVMGNPPYVRQESITAPVVHGVQVTDDKKEYKAKLALSVYQAFPHFFGYKAGTKTAAHKINAKSDLYIYFYLRSLKLLNSKGSFCFITSNSWLDVGYGADLQEFLLKHSRVKLVLDNQVKRSFANADVNSIIVLFSSPDDRGEWALDETARFVMFRVPFEHILSPVIFDEIEEATDRKATKEYRVFPIQQSKLLEDGCEIPEQEGETEKAAGPLIKTARYIGNKWGGKYLRAPDIYWTILEKGKGKLISIEPSIGEVLTVSWSRQGRNSEIMVDRDLSEGTIIPVLKSPREFDGILVRSGDARTFLRSRRVAQSQIVRTPIVWDDIRGERHICRLNQDMLPFTHNFHGIRVHKPEWVRNVCASLNSTVVWLFVETLGRHGLGGGAVRILVEDLKRTPLLLHPSSFTSGQIQEFESAFEVLISRPAMDVKSELLDDHGTLGFLPGRGELDEVVFDVLGLSHSEREAVYEAVIDLVEARLKKVGSV